MAQMLPQLNKTDIERQQHHHTGGNAKHKEEVVEPLLCPNHF
jgi:hypothetical protein